MHHLDALPLLIDGAGDIHRLSAHVPGDAVFSGDEAVFNYMVGLAKRDLQYRGFRDGRIACFQHKQEANFLLHRRVQRCVDQHEYAKLRQDWDTINRPKYRRFTWGVQQQAALDLVSAGYGHDDEEARRLSYRFLYINGEPGSGKSTVLLECAIQACVHVSVLIVCPTGMLVNAFKSKLPDITGIDNITIDTIQGVLNYKRPGADSKVTWAPPTALRKYDVILCDEGSQYDDPEWQRLYTSIKEQPHSPFVAVVADFQQLQPVSGGSLCRQFCDKMQSITLDTVYRSADPSHLLFLNRIRQDRLTGIIG